MEKVGLIATVIVAVVVLVAANFFAALGVGLVGVILSVWIRNNLRRAAMSQCTQSCVVPYVAVRYVGWHGTVMSFDFDSEQYAMAFAEANQQKLVSGTQQVSRASSTVTKGPNYAAAFKQGQRIGNWVGKSGGRKR